MATPKPAPKTLKQYVDEIIELLPSEVQKVSFEVRASWDEPTGAYVVGERYGYGSYSPLPVMLRFTIYKKAK